MKIYSNYHPVGGLALFESDSYSYFIRLVMSTINNQIYILCCLFVHLLSFNLVRNSPIVNLSKCSQCTSVNTHSIHQKFFSLFLLCLDLHICYLILFHLYMFRHFEVECSSFNQVQLLRPHYYIDCINI